MSLVREDALHAERLLSHNLERELWFHAGKWVVVTRDELVAVADTPREAFDKAKESRDSLEGLFLHYVPESEGKLYFF